MIFPFYEQAPKEEVKSCNLCGSTRYALIATVDRYGFDTSWVKCKECGLIFLSYRMTSEAYREFYEGGHYRRLFSELTNAPVNELTIQSDQARYARYLSKFLAPHINGASGGLLLDLGGSTGTVSERLAMDFNLDATVVEPSAAEAQRARANGLAVVQAPLLEFDPHGTHYDLVLLCRTVEHLLDIKAALALIKGWLAPGGMLFLDFVTVPQMKIDHPYYLTPVTMQRYLVQAGFVVKAQRPAPDARHFNMLCGRGEDEHN